MSLLYIEDKKYLNEILNNQELNAFFTKFTNHYNIICEVKEKEKNNQIEEITPNFNELDLLIEKIEKVGIRIEGIPKFKERMENDTFFLHKPYLGPLTYLYFNGIVLQYEDISYIMDHPTKLETKIDYLESVYDLKKKENRNIEKKIAKLEKKEASSINSIYEEMERDKKIKTLKTTLSYMKNLETRISFIKNQTAEQRMLLAEFFSVSKELFYTYAAFYSKKDKIIKKARKEEKNTIKEAYEEMLKHSIVMIDIDSIIKKLFKTLLKSELEELKQEYIDTEESENEEEISTLTINVDVLNWFINENENKIIELFKNAFDDVEEISETLNDKILKKQI